MSKTFLNRSFGAITAMLLGAAMLVALSPSAEAGKPKPTTTTTTIKPTTTTTSTTTTTTTSTTTTTVPAGTKAMLYVWIDGWGSGTIVSSPEGINCHLVSSGDPYGTDFQQSLTGPCNAEFLVGSTVTLTATPDPGNFLGGGGIDTGNSTFTNPNTRVIYNNYNPAEAVFCPNEGLCMSY